MVSLALAATVHEGVIAGDASGPRTAAERLSDRDDVLRLTADGDTVRGIAARLDLSQNTVETHRRRLMGKFGVGGVAGLTRCAIREGLTDVRPGPVLRQSVP